ncbi:hypothetical protein AOLI_G00163190 [Acnodon oligacanthus]
MALLYESLSRVKKLSFSSALPINPCTERSGTALHHRLCFTAPLERPGSLPSVLRRSPPTCPLTSTLGVLFIIPTAGRLSYLPFPMPHRPPTGLEQCLRLTHAE